MSSFGLRPITKSELGALEQRHMNGVPFGIELDQYSGGFSLTLRVAAGGVAAQHASNFARKMQDCGWIWWREHPWLWLFVPARPKPESNPDDDVLDARRFAFDRADAPDAAHPVGNRGTHAAGGRIYEFYGRG